MVVNRFVSFSFPLPNEMFYLIGSEYFLRKQINFERLTYPITNGENIEPLIDLFLTRPQFIREIPQLNNLSHYLLLPQSISALLFFDSPFNSSARHSCYELRTKENQNKFTVKDLISMSQRENNIIQMNALNDKRYQDFKNELSNIYSYKSTLPLSEHKPSKLNFAENITKSILPISRPSLNKYSKMKNHSR